MKYAKFQRIRKAQIPLTQFKKLDKIHSVNKFKFAEKEFNPYSNMMEINSRSNGQIMNK